MPVLCPRDIWDTHTPCGSALLDIRFLQPCPARYHFLSPCHAALVAPSVPPSQAQARPLTRSNSAVIEIRQCYQKSTSGAEIAAEPVEFYYTL
jgi:hypothetical protein